MRPVTVFLTSIAVLSLLVVNAEANNKQVGGLIIGGSTGAIVGNSIGKNTESTIIGATVVGVLGYVIGNELNRHHGPEIRHTKVVTHSQKYYKRPKSLHKNQNRHHKYRRNVYHQSHKYHQPQTKCKKIITVHKRHNKTKKVIKTSCVNKKQNHDRRKRHYRGIDRHSQRYYR